jgi:type VI protein secretion system component VasK
MIFVSMFMAVTVCILYTNQRAEKDTARWCALLGTLDSSYDKQPPKTLTGIQVAYDIRELYNQFGCERRK